jgi:hypothetical protein
LLTRTFGSFEKCCISTLEAGEFRSSADREFASSFSDQLQTQVYKETSSDHHWVKNGLPLLPDLFLVIWFKQSDSLPAVLHPSDIISHHQLLKRCKSSVSATCVETGVV